MPDFHFYKFNMSYEYIDRALNRAYYEYDICKTSNDYHKKYTKSKQLKCNIIYYKTLKLFIEKNCNDEDIKYILNNI